MFQIASPNLWGLMTQRYFQSHQKVRVHGKELEQTAVWQTSNNLGRTVVVNLWLYIVQITVLVHINKYTWTRFSQMRHFSSVCGFFCLFWSKHVCNNAGHNLADRQETAERTISQAVPYRPQNATKQRVCAISLIVWHSTRSLHASGSMQLGLRSIIHGHNVVSVFSGG